jgi:hypothetical protein
VRVSVLSLAVTQFHESADTRVLTNITRYYLQKGKRIDLPTLYVVKPKGGQAMGANENENENENAALRTVFSF